MRHRFCIFCHFLIFQVFFFSFILFLFMISWAELKSQRAASLWSKLDLFYMLNKAPTCLLVPSGPQGSISQAAFFYRFITGRLVYWFFPSIPLLVLLLLLLLLLHRPSSAHSPFFYSPIVRFFPAAWPANGRKGTLHTTLTHRFSLFTTKFSSKVAFVGGG